MASARYTLNIDPKDLQPDQPRELTREEKLANWWSYHWKFVVPAVVLAVIVCYVVYLMCHQVEPDYRLGIITRRPVAQEAAQQLGAALVPFGEDLNGDGQVVFYVETYTMDMRPMEVQDAERLAAADDPEQGGKDMLANMDGMASQARLTVDMQDRHYMIYLTDDPEGLQRLSGVLGSAQGVPGTGTTEETLLQGVDVFPWQSCPVLSGLELGTYQDLLGENTYETQSALKDLVLVRRAFTEDQPMAENQQQNAALFQALTQGAQPQKQVQ